MLDDGRIVRQHLDHICEQVYEPVTETDSHIDSGSDASLDLPSVESCETLTDLFNADNSPEPSTIVNWRIINILYYSYIAIATCMRFFKKAN